MTNIFSCDAPGSRETVFFATFRFTVIQTGTHSRVFFCLWAVKWFLTIGCYFCARVLTMKLGPLMLKKFPPPLYDIVQAWGQIWIKTSTHSFMVSVFSIQLPAGNTRTDTFWIKLIHKLKICLRHFMHVFFFYDLFPVLCFESKQKHITKTWAMGYWHKAWNMKHWTKQKQNMNTKLSP